MTPPGWGVVAVRLLVFVVGAVAVACTLPGGPGDDGWLPLLAVGLVAALVPAVFPGHWPTTAFELLVVAAWFVRTTLPDVGVDWWTLAVLAITLYVHHTACALAATLPWDTSIAPGVLGRRALRTLLVAVPTVVLAAVAGLVPAAWRDTAPVAVVGLGVLLVVATVGLPTYVFWEQTVRRRDRGRPDRPG